MLATKLSKAKRCQAGQKDGSDSRQSEGVKQGDYHVGYMKLKRT
jgi:hypothetical protein